MSTRPRKKRHYTRTTNGCLTCRGRHVKCDGEYLLRIDGRERGGSCRNCELVGRDCVRRPLETFIVVKSSTSTGRDETRESTEANSGEKRDGAVQEIRTYPVSGGRVRTARQLAYPADTALPDYITRQQHNEGPEGEQDGACQIFADILSEQDQHRQSPNSGALRPNIRQQEGDGLQGEDSTDPARTGLYYGALQPSPVSPASVGCRQPRSPNTDTCDRGSELSSSYAVDQRVGSINTTSNLSAHPPTRESLLPFSLFNSETFRCFHHYITEVGPWNDLWDDQQRFARVVPREALSCPPLLAACVALGAKHLSLTSYYESSRVMQLYNDAIHRLMPVIDATSNDRTSSLPSALAVETFTHGQILATLVIMAQYEMSSHSNRTFREHLTGASRYISHHGLRPESLDPLGQAAFITYARRKFSSILSCQLHNHAQNKN